MLKLIKLELKKYKINGSLLGVLIASVAVLIFILSLIIGNKTEEGMVLTNYTSVFLMVNIFVRTTFVIFGGAMIAKYIIDEYKSKTIQVMFMYPISRKKLMASKLIIVSGFTFLSIIFSSVFISVNFIWINHVFHLFQDSIRMDLIKEIMGMYLMNAVLSTGITLIPLFFGMLRKSTVATIISAIVISSVISSGNNGNSIYSIIIIPIVLVMIGIAIAYLSIWNIDKKDVVN